MPAAPTVLGAVFDVLAADGQLGSMVPGGAWLDEVPSELPLPWLVVDHVRADQTFHSEGSFENTRFKVVVWASHDAQAPAGNPAHPAQTAEMILGRVLTVLNQQPWDVEGCSEISLVWSNYTVSLAKDRGPDDERVYRAEVECLAKLSRP